MVITIESLIVSVILPMRLKLLFVEGAAGQVWKFFASSELHLFPPIRIMRTMRNMRDFNNVHKFNLQILPIFALIGRYGKSMNMELRNVLHKENGESYSLEYLGCFGY